MFQRTSKRLYWWPVYVAIPEEDPRKAGMVSKHACKLQFALMSRDEAKALQDDDAALLATDRRDFEINLLKRVTRDWADVVDEDKQPIPFSEEAFAETLGDLFFRQAVYHAYLASLTGDQARRGN